MSTPTEMAETYFADASKHADRAVSNYGYYRAVPQQDKYEYKQTADMALARAVYDLSRGLKHLSVGLRATYLLLDEVKGLRQK